MSQNGSSDDSLLHTQTTPGPAHAASQPPSAALLPPAQSPDPLVPAGPSPAQLFPARTRTGAIARLPKDIRRRINEMLDDGLPYLDIIHHLGQDGLGLNEDILGRWKKGGYQDHLREQRLLAQCVHRRHHALDQLARSGPLDGFQATQQIATSQICEAMIESGTDLLREALAANPLNYFRMLNAFTRLTNGGLKCERHLAKQAARSAGPGGAAPKKGISPESVKEMKEKLKLM